MGMSTPAAPSTVEHTGSGPSRCLACGQFAGDGHACPPRAAAAADHQALGLYSTELYATAPAASSHHSALTDDVDPAPAAPSPSAQDELRQARIAVGLAALQHRRTGDRGPLEAALARRDTALTQLRQGEPHDVVGDVQDRCPSCGQYQADDHTCPLPSGMPSADYSGHRGDDRAKAMLADLQSAVTAIVESGQLQRWLDAMASNGLNRWSLNNRLLAIMQLAHRGEPLEEAHMMGFRQWEKLDRHVRAGEKAIWILAPMTRKIREDAADGTSTEKTIVTGFKGVPVFNVSQTEGADLPQAPLSPPGGEATPGTLEGLRTRVAAAGYDYEETVIPDCVPETGRGTLGYTDPATKKIVVDQRLSGEQKASTIAHELGHVHCGHVEDLEEYRRHRGRQETEAEMTAYMVNRARGMSRSSADSFSPGYIASWSRGKPEVVVAAMDRATKAFNKIMDGDWES